MIPAAANGGDKDETMLPKIATIIGGLAAIASTVSFLPQAIKIIQTRNTTGISTGMYCVTVFGFALWTTYGIVLKAWPLIVSNSICLALSAFILAMKLLPQPKKHAVADTVEKTVGKKPRRVKK